MPLPPPSPLAEALAQECCDRIRAFHDAQTSQLLIDMKARGIIVRDQLGSLMMNASQLSAHTQAKVELMVIGASSTEEIATKAREKVRRYFLEHVPKLRDLIEDMVAEDLACERKEDARG